MHRARKIVTAMVSQHAELAAHLWLIRSAAVRAADHDLEALAKLDSRIEAHLDGLLAAGEDAWPILTAGLEAREAGEVFAASLVALQSGKTGIIERILAIVAEAGDTAPGLISAGGWASGAVIRQTASAWCGSRDALRRRLGLAICRVRRANCGRFLEQGLSDADAAVRAEALRTLGCAGRVDLASRLPEHFGDPDEANRFAAAWSAVRLGDRTALPLLAGLAVSSRRFGAPALELVVRAMPIEPAGRWVRSLGNAPHLRRQVVQAVGMIGDPAAVPWLLEVMANNDLARLAGSAFALITGVDLAEAGLDAEPPVGWVSGPTDDPNDDDVSLDRDRVLPWPNRALLERWWSGHGGRYARGVRHAGGRPINRQACMDLLHNGFQPQRRAAALELALHEPGTRLFNIAAPAIAQRATLELGGEQEPGREAN